jgi:integration host factor subunit alpha
LEPYVLERAGKKERRTTISFNLADPSGGVMSSGAVTRTNLCEVVCNTVGLSRTESSELLELVLEEICACLVGGEAVKLSSFGSFIVRTKRERVGRNPKTGEVVPIPPRRVLIFKSSSVLKATINATLAPAHR